MKKVLNIIVLILGIILVLQGFYSFINNSGSMELALGDKYVKLSSPSLFHVILVRCIGGLSFIYHAATTFRFEKENIHHGLKSFRKMQIITGLIIYIVSFYLVIELFTILGQFENKVKDFFLLIVFLVIIKSILIVFPCVLVAKNFSVNKLIKN